MQSLRPPPMPAASQMSLLDFHVSRFDLPNLDDNETVETISLSDINRRYWKYQSLAIRRIVLLGIRKSFDLMPDLEAVYARMDRSTNVRTVLYSNPAQEIYIRNTHSSTHKDSPGYLRDRRFDKVFSQVRKRLGPPSRVLEEMATLIGHSPDGRPVSMTRWNHRPLIDHLLSSDVIAFQNNKPLSRWDDEAIAQADAATLDQNTPLSVSPGRRQRL